jgi:hypothetical protein
VPVGWARAHPPDGSWEGSPPLTCYPPRAGAQRPAERAASRPVGKGQDQRDARGALGSPQPTTRRRTVTASDSDGPSRCAATAGPGRPARLERNPSNYRRRGGPATDSPEWSRAEFPFHVSQGRGPQTRLSALPQPAHLRVALEEEFTGPTSARPCQPVLEFR